MSDLLESIKRHIAIRERAVKPEGFSARTETETQVDALQEMVVTLNQQYQHFEASGLMTTAQSRNPFKRGFRKFVRRVILGPVKDLQAASWQVMALQIQTLNKQTEIINRQSQHIAKLETGFVKVLTSNAILEKEWENFENDQYSAQEYLKTISEKVDFLLHSQNISCDIDLIKNASIDYMAFENNFRGSRELIKERQQCYLPYFQKVSDLPILDIGSGRGEFLELMKEHGITAEGIEMYSPFVDFCNNRGLRVTKEDGLSYLSKLPDASLGGIFMSHVVEHLNNNYLISLLAYAYRKLRIGGVLIFETPNPEALAVYKTFNVDLSHFKPIHYATMKFTLAQLGFQDVQRYDNPLTKYPQEIVKLTFSDKEKERLNIDAFNKSLEELSDLIYGNLDYAVIAQK